jgi:hypothetical protein
MTHPEHRSIGELAYRLWQSRGCPDGTAEQDWLDAERQLRAMQASTRPVKPEDVKAAEAVRKKSPRQKSPGRSSRSNPNSDSMR